MRTSRLARLSALILAAVSCSSSSTSGPDGGSGGDGGTPNHSYTVSMVTSVCDDLSSATILKLGATTHVTAFTDLPFPFPLFGDTATQFVIAESGHIYIGTSVFLASVGEPQKPPDVTIPNGWVAPFWDPLLTYVPNLRGDVRVLLTGTGADERFVMGYNDFTLAFPSPPTPNPDVHLSFQVALLRQSQAIEIRYCQLDPGPNPTPQLQDRVRGGSAGIGIEASDGAVGISYSYKTPMQLAGTAIRFTPAP